MGCFLDLVDVPEKFLEQYDEINLNQLLPIIS
jgi:hypothetical protein